MFRELGLGLVSRCSPGQALQLKDPLSRSPFMSVV